MTLTARRGAHLRGKGRVIPGAGHRVLLFPSQRARATRDCSWWTLIPSGDYSAFAVAASKQFDAMCASKFGHLRLESFSFGEIPKRTRLDSEVDPA